MPIAAASLLPHVSALLTKWSKEAWIPSQADSIPTGVISATELLERCSVELFGGLKMSELLSILHTLHSAGTWMVLGDDPSNTEEVSDDVQVFVVLDEDWLMRQVLSPVSIMSVDRMTLAHAHSTLANLALGVNATDSPLVTKCLLSLLLAINYAVVIDDEVIFILRAKLTKQPAIVPLQDEEVESVTVASRLMVDSPSGGIEPFTWRMLLAHLVKLHSTIPCDAGASVKLWSDAIELRSLKVGNILGDCMVQQFNYDAIDVLVKVQGDADTDDLARIFAKFRDAITDFLSQQRTVRVTVYDDLKGDPDVWTATCDNRVAVCSNRPPSPVFIRKQSSLEPEVTLTEAAEEEEEEPHSLASSGGGGDVQDTVWYRDDWNLLDDLDNEHSSWKGLRSKLTCESKIGTSKGRFEVMLPHPRNIKLTTSIDPVTSVESSLIEGIVDITDSEDDVAVARCRSVVGSTVLVSCLSTWDNPVMDLVGTTITYVSEVPFDTESVSITMDAQAVNTALATLRYPLYLTLASEEEETTAVGDTRAFKLLLLSTTRQVVQNEKEWRLTGDVGPGPISWRLVVSEFNPKVPATGVEHTVTVDDYRIVASYPVDSQVAKQFVHDHARDKTTSEGRNSKAVEGLVYVHGFLTPLCNALKSAAIFARCFNRLTICFSWPCDPQLVNHSWIVTKVHSPL
jgi:hypothetical protein